MNAMSSGSELELQRRQEPACLLLLARAEDPDKALPPQTPRPILRSQAATIRVFYIYIHIQYLYILLVCKTNTAYADMSSYAYVHTYIDTYLLTYLHTYTHTRISRKGLLNAVVSVGVL